MKIGIYGGSFNPVHNGHIHLAETVVEEFGLDVVYFVPTKISPHRSVSEYAPENDRLEMLNIVCGKSRKFRVSDYELKSNRISYSVYTVEHFRKKFPDDDIFLLVGSDMFLGFEKWYQFEKILSCATLCVVSREKGDIEELCRKCLELSEYGNILISRKSPRVVSSTEIRKKIRENSDFACYLDENVVQYIRMKGLYSADN